MSPTGTILAPMQHAFGAPAFAEAKVVDAMRLDVVTRRGDAGESPS